MPVIVDKLSPEFEDRAAGKEISFLILHYTGTSSADVWYEESIKLGVSVHYLVDEDGTIFRVVDEEKKAWHAGQSYWAGEEDLNSCSIGIEIQNAGHKGGLPAYPDVQIAAVIELCRDILSRYDIPAHHVLAHSDIAPARKPDPGEHFPWDQLAEAGIGLWWADDWNKEQGVGDVSALLAEYGYDMRVDLVTLMKAFQRHFVPEVFTVSMCSGADVLITVKKVKSLINQLK